MGMEGDLPVSVQRADEDGLDWHAGGSQAVVFAPAASITEVGPVGGLVAGAGKAVFLDEGFGENDGMAVALEPVLAKTLGGKRKEPGGEVSNPCPRQDEEAGVVDEEMEALPTFLRGPADEAIPTRDLEGRGVPNETGDRS